MFLLYINKSNIAFELSKSISLERLNHNDKQTSWEEFKVYLRQLSKHIFKLEQQRDVKDNEKLIQNAQRYIRENVDKDISLTQLSRVFHFNASYFSRMYKNITGENVTSYITRVKLERAKGLLSDNSLKISKIAKLLGFKTPSYFTYFFKKNTNISPQQYRDRNTF